jgi:hypothetical protein
MSTIVKLDCNGCSTGITITVDANLSKVNAAGINFNQNCPKCGSALSLPAGTYEKDAEGVLVKVGEHSPQN